jgi:hypothetical protein
MLKLKDSVEFNALDIDYTNVREFIDGNIILDLKLTKKTDRKDFEEILKKIRQYKNYTIKVKIDFIESVDE